MIPSRASSKVSYLRVGLIAANLSLSLSLFFGWYSNLFESEKVGVRDRSYDRLIIREFGARHGTSILDTAFVASALQPRRVMPKIEIVKTETETLTPQEPAYGPGGPLEDDWEFSMFLGTEDGTIAMVQLTHRGETAGPPTRAQQARARRSTRRPERPWTFFVADRFIQHETRELAIVAHAAGAAGFEYSVRDIAGGPWTLPFNGVRRGAALEGNSEPRDEPPGFRSGTIEEREQAYQDYLKSLRERSASSS